METSRFLSRVLGEEGFYCVFASRSKDDRRVQKFYDSLDAVISAAANFDSEGYDAYFALATFAEPNSRKVDNAMQMRSFFLDLDCGPSKDFPTQADAVSALRKFCKDTGLPRPIMVNSGRGVHVYWALTEPVNASVWVSAAERLKALCAKHKFAADPAVTADIARVLRVPTTHNYKSDPPSPVSLFGVDQPEPVDFTSFVSLFGMDLMPVSRKYIPADINATQAALAGNRDSKFKDIILKTQEGRGCAQILEMLTNPATTPEPLWRAGLSIAKFCSDGTKAAYLMSEGHPEFNEEDMYQKMEAVKGPYLCNRFNEYRPGICDSCPNFGKIKSPINLGSYIKEATDEDNLVVDKIGSPPPELFAAAQVEEENLTLPHIGKKVYTIPKYPTPYFRGATGGVYLRKRDENGDPDDRCIYHNDIYIFKRILDPEAGESAVFRLHLPKDGVREFTMSLAAITSRDEFRKNMSIQGIAVKNMDDLMSYSLQWINELQAAGSADLAHRQFGWADEEFDSFILGEQKIRKDSIEFNPPSVSTLAMFDNMKPKGTLDGWKEVMSFYNRPGFEAHQFVVGTAFGSPLMAFTAIHCAALHLHSKDSGFGKTTGMLAAMSVWGSPEGLVLTKEDTFNAKMNRSEVYHNIPLYIDEITNLKGEQLSDMIYQITTGKQRARMSSGSNVERYRGLPWNLLAVTTGNASVIEAISMIKDSPKAEAQRILELRIDQVFKKPEDKESTDIFSKDIYNNWGHAGIVYVQYIMSNLEECKALVIEVQKRVDKAAGLTAQNRFWSAMVATVIAGLIIAKRAGLVDYDTSTLTQWAVTELLGRNQRVSADMTIPVKELVNDYIHEKWQNILWIKSTQDLRGSHNSGLDDLVVPDAQPKGQLVARFETDTKKIYLLPKPFKKWCGDQQINFTALVEEMKSKLGAKKMKMRLSKGTHMNLPPSDVIAVDWTMEKDLVDVGAVEA